MFFFPFPGMLQKFFTTEIGFLNAFVTKFGNYFGFGSNGSMIGAGNPAGIEAFHAGTAYDNILNGIVEHVTHVQYARNIRRRYYDGIGWFFVRFRMEISFFHPVCIPLIFGFLRIILRRYLHCSYYEY